MLVDYTHAAVVAENVRAAVERGVGVVVGSSGLTASDYEQIDARAREREVGVVAAGNFSLSAALVLRFATEAARHLERGRSSTTRARPSRMRRAGLRGSSRSASRRCGRRSSTCRSARCSAPPRPAAPRSPGRRCTPCGCPASSSRRRSSSRSGRAAHAPPRRGRQPRAIRRRNAARDPRRARPRGPDTRARPAASRLGLGRDPRRPLGRDQEDAAVGAQPGDGPERGALGVGDQRPECRERRGARLADREPGARSSRTASAASASSPSRCRGCRRAASATPWRRPRRSRDPPSSCRVSGCSRRPAASEAVRHAAVTGSTPISVMPPCAPNRAAAAAERADAGRDEQRCRTARPSSSANSVA